MTVEWAELVAGAIDLRHELHQRPELAWAEHDTASFIRDRLDEFGIAWRACAGTGTVAALAEQATGRHVALRADIDAMPVQEATGVPYASERGGVMHACGHDGHMATLLASARWLAEHESHLPGPVTLLFQPAEEGGHGARGMILDRALTGQDPGPGRPVEAIFGWHNWPAIPFGRAACPDGPVMAANGTFEIEVVGVGGHASQPEETRDPVVAAAAITLALQQVVARRIAPQESAVLAVTRLDAGTADTVTPDRAVLGGSIRVAGTDRRDEVFAMIKQVATDTARSWGVTATTTPAPRYGATINHPGAADELRTALDLEMGGEWPTADVAIPVMASEDFSDFLNEVPGAFVLVGAGDGTSPSCHSPEYDFNDDLIDPVARVLVRVVGAPVEVPART